MTEEQIKNISTRLLETASLVCTDKDQKRAFLQGARQMAHVLAMNDLISMEDRESISTPIDKEIDEILKAKIS